MFLLLGMMVIVSVIKRTGVFEYLAIWCAKRARGSRSGDGDALVLTAVASAVLDNVTTVLLIAPVTFLVCERLGLNPVPFLIAEVLASNIGGTATLVGDPPNIIIASRAGLFLQRLPHPPGALGRRPDVRLLPMCRVLFRSRLRLRRGTGRVGDVAGRARGDQDTSAARESLGGAGPRGGGVRPAHGAALRAVGGGAARRRAPRVDHRGRDRPRRSRTSSGRRWCSSPACSSWSAGWCRRA